MLLQPWFHLGLCVEFAFDVRLSLCLAPLKDLNWRFRVDLIHAFGRIKLGRFRQRGVLTSGATSLVSLIERHELSAFGVSNLGEAADTALRRVREARQGAVETHEQEALDPLLDVTGRLIGVHA